MSLKRNIFLSIFLFFAFAFNSAYAIDEKEFVNASDCGVENNVVEFFSWDICEQDFAFRIFYKLFPDVIDEQILPIVNSTYLGKVKELEADNLEMNRAYQYSLLKILEIMYSLSLLFGVYVFAWHAGLALLRTATEGSFLGKDYNPTKTAVKYGVVLFLLLPVGNGLVVAHWFVFVLILFSIALGNLFYGIFLNFIDAGSDTANLNADKTTFSETDEERTEKYDDYIKANSSDHNFFYATELAKKLLKSNVCKTRTEQFIFESNLSKLSSSNANQYYQCSAESVLNSQILNSSVSGSGFVDSGGFASYKTVKSNIKNGSADVNFTSGIRFGKNLQNSSCQNIPGIYSYSCGEINVSTPTVSDAKTLEVMEKVGFYGSYANVSSNIMSTDGATSASIAATATQGWNALSDKLVNELATSINGEKKLTPSDETIIKNIAYVYHQLLLNDSMTGAANISGNGLISPSGNAPIKNKLQKISEVTKTIIDNYCIGNQEMIKKSKNLVKFVNGFNEDNNKDMSASCLIIPKSAPTSTYGIEFDQDKAGVLAGRTEIEKKVDAAKETLLTVVKDIKNKREGIELSLFKSLKSVSNLSITAQMRKIGFASAGGFMLKIIKEKDIDNKFMRSLQNSIGFTDGMIDNKFIGKELVANKDNVSSTLNNSNYSEIAYYYNQVTQAFTTSRRDLRMTDIAPMVSSVFDDSLSEASKSDDFASTIMNFVTNPLGNFKTAIGIGAEKDIYEDVIKKCMDDLKECPIPLENPIKGLSDFGHNLISASANLIAASLTLTFTKYVKEKYVASKILKDKGGNISNSKNIFSSLGDKIGTSVAGKTVGKILSVGLDMSEFIMSSLVDVLFLLMSLGIFFAYVIPLVPFMMFTFAFLSWVTICLLTLFIVPMWVIFNLRMTEERNGNSEMYLSGYNIIMQILLRPSLLIVALVLGWGIFIVAFLILNLTIIPFIYGVLLTDGGTFSLVGLMNSVMIVLIYGILVHMILRYVFQFMYSITNKMFQAMNVTPIDDKANIAEQVMQSAVMASVLNFQVVKSLNKNLQRETEKNTKETKEHVTKSNRDDEVDLIIKDKLGDRYVDDKPDNKD